jgi:hypothetical protein
MSVLAEALLPLALRSMAPTARPGTGWRWEAQDHELSAGVLLIAVGSGACPARSGVVAATLRITRVGSGLDLDLGVRV